MRTRSLWISLIAVLVATPLFAQETAVPPPDGPWWWRVIVFVVSLPWTLYRVFAEGERMYLLPAPLLGLATCLWSLREWRRQRFWTPRLIHVMAALGLATIIGINVSWVMAGGTMWTQRYVVIAIFGLFPYVAYLLFLGPKYLGRKRAPASIAPPPLDPLQPFQPRGQHLTVPSGDAERRHHGLRRTYAWGGAALVGLLFAAFALSPTQDVPSPRMMGGEFDALDDPESLVPLAHGIERGAPNAPITIIEFGDFQCPACGAFARREWPKIKEAFIDSGRAKFVFFDLPLTSLHDNTLEASRAARCADDQGRFWDYHDELLLQQEQWSPIPDPTAAFVRYAMTLELDDEAFRSCLEGGRHADVIAANRELASRLGLSSTPTILIRTEGGPTWRSPQRFFEQVSETFEEVARNAGLDRPPVSAGAG